MTKQEKEEWNNLYEYVRANVMGYDKNQSLSKNMVLRLKGLSTGKYIENKLIKDMSSYSFDVILNTFKYCYPEISKAFMTKSFNSENHRFNYAIKIVESKLNDVYMRMRNSEKAKEKAEHTDLSIITEVDVDYFSFEHEKPKEIPEKFKAIW